MAVRLIILLLASLTLTAQPWSATSLRLRETAKVYHGMVETGYNRGPSIDLFNKKYAYLEAPYCASGLSYLLDAIKASHPNTRSARALDFVNPGCVTKSIDLYTKKKKITRPCVGVFKRSGGGHVCVVLRQSGDTLFTFEFNTSPGIAGSQWNGEWSGFRTRSVKKDCAPLNGFKFTHFIEIHIDDATIKSLAGVPDSLLDGGDHRMVPTQAVTGW